MYVCMYVYMYIQPPPPFEQVLLTKSRCFHYSGSNFAAYTDIYICIIHIYMYTCV